MKTEFPILNISPTQWVLVDKTRKPKNSEYYIHYHSPQFPGRPEKLDTDIVDTNRLILGKHLPVLAAYPKIYGVLLLPSTLWEKKENKLLWAIEELDSCLIEAPTDFIGPTWRAAQREEKEWRQRWKKALEVAREAAGGYTKEQMRKAFDWGATLQGADETLDEKEFDAFLAELKSPSPRALEIEVGEDGSLPSENGVLIYTEVIY